MTLSVVRGAKPLSEGTVPFRVPQAEVVDSGHARLRGLGPVSFFSFEKKDKKKKTARRAQPEKGNKPKEKSETCALAFLLKVGVCLKRGPPQKRHPCFPFFKLGGSRRHTRIFLSGVLSTYIPCLLPYPTPNTHLFYSAYFEQPGYSW